jgi:hypothetical protein
MLDDEYMQLLSEATEALLLLKDLREVTKAFPLGGSEMREIWHLGQDDPDEVRARLADFNKPSLRVIITNIKTM